mmetsp:Transcript_67656/g.195881  ORF Transcript_67656/g.195881 Transcript_67656/m.195881 type:complete len:582 (+) Transcript_67656:171-1916(+)
MMDSRALELEAPGAGQNVTGTAAPDLGEGQNVKGTVGVLGWFGFAIINFAAWGIIAMSSSIAWQAGFVVTSVYTVFLICTAVFLRRVGPSYVSFENLLWVLACWFVFVLGIFLALNVVGPRRDDDEMSLVPDEPDTVSDVVDNDLQRLLPVGSSHELVSWAADTTWRTVKLPTYAEFLDHVYFTGMSKGFLDLVSRESMLLRTDGSTTTYVQPKLANARTFVNFDSKLYFLAQEASSSTRHGLWSIDSDGASDSPPRAQYVGGPWTSGLVVYSETQLTELEGKLFFKAEYDCPAGWTRAIFCFDKDLHNLTNLRVPRCPEVIREGIAPGKAGVVTNSMEKPYEQYWGGIFFACLPMMLLAAVVMWKFRMHGMFANLYIGLALVVSLLYLLAAPDDNDHRPFFKWFFSLYSLAAYLALSYYCMTMIHIPQFVEKMKGWIVSIAGITFFVMTHIDFEVPGTLESRSWFFYALAIILQMFVSIAVQRILPLICACIGTYLVAWKFSREIVRLIFGDRLGEVETAALLALLAFQGIGITVAASIYTSRREHWDKVARETLLEWLTGFRSRRRRPLVQTETPREIG